MGLPPAAGGTISTFVGDTDSLDPGSVAWVRLENSRPPALRDAASRSYILTNRHVAGPGPFWGLCIFDQEAVSCRPLYIDPIHDFAFLMYDPESIQHMQIDGLGLSADGASVGQPVLVVGNDAGEATSIIDGAISQTDRNAPEYDGPYSDFNIGYYMANMNLSGGISGSPALGEDGLVLGMVSGGGVTDGAICFLLPTGAVLQTLCRLRRGQDVPRGDIQVIYARLASLHRRGTSVLTLDTPSGITVFSKDEATGLWRGATIHLHPLPPPPPSRTICMNKISPRAQFPNIIPNLIHVESRAYLSLDGHPAALARGMGVIVDAGAGLAIVSRNVVPHKACYIRITLGSSTEATARCVFLHAHHCYAVIQYDASSAPSDVDGVTLGNCRLHSGSEASLIYFSGPEQLLQGDAVLRSVVLTRPALRPTTPSFECQPVNADLIGIEVPSEVQRADGVVVSSDGSVQAVWMPGIGGLTVGSLSKVLSHCTRDSIPALHVMPAEMEVVSMRQARIMDVPEDFLRSVAESTCTSSIFM
ncbi:hypothetical protein ARSEF4850_009922, partial [Beauveria asiatica]